MRLFSLFFLIFSCPIWSKIPTAVFHKTVGQVEAYKKISTLHMPVGKVKRLTKNLLTPIHKKRHAKRAFSQHVPLKKTCKGPVTVKFLLPLTLKDEIVSLLKHDHLSLSIPLEENNIVKSDNLEIDRLSIAPKGLFAMKCTISSELLHPSEVIFIHLLKDDTVGMSL